MISEAVVKLNIEREEWYSEPSPAIGLCVHVLVGVAGKLGKHRLWRLEVLPGPLGTDIDSAVGVAGPAVVPRIEVVVRIHIRCHLMSIVATTVQPVLRLQG